MAKRSPCVGVSVRHEWEGPTVTKGHARAVVEFVGTSEFESEYKISCHYAGPKGRITKSAVTHKNGREGAVRKACALVKRRCRRK